jgi:predicted transcriptional regulator
METFPASGPVKTQIIGKETHEKEESSVRVQQDMNYQLTEVMTEYRPEHEKLLWSLPITGSAFKKVYFDPNKGRQVAVFIPAEDIVVPYGASSIEDSERVTHVMRKTKNEVLKLQEAGFYRDVELGDPSYELDDIEKQKAEEQGMSAIQDDRFRILEMHVNLDIKGFEHTNEDGEETGIALPYVVTIEKGTGEILAIRRNWYEDDILNIKRQHFVHYQYIPGFGFYGYGLIHLIGGYAKSATMLIRQLVDAGTLSNLPGGLKSRGLRIKGDDTPIQPGEFRDVDVPSGSIRDNILPLPYKEPSQVLFALFQNIVEEGRSFASSGDMNVSDMSANAPVGTTLALLERTLKVMGAVQSRMHYSMRQEFKLLKVIIADYTPEEYDYEPTEGSRAAKKSDYEDVDVIPVSDPNAATMAQKIVQYQAVLQLAQTAPQIYNMPLLHRQMIEVLGVKNAQKLVPTEDDEIPTDPIQENQDLLTGKPVKAFMEQDHKAHIQVHQLAMQDPKIMQLVGQNPRAQMIQAAMMAHLNEHIGFEYRRQIQEKMGLALPTEEQNKKVSPELANQIAQIAAQAAQELFQQNSAEAKQMAAQQQMQDPVVQMQQQELQIRMEDLKLKAQKQQIDAAQKADQIRVEESRIEAQKEIAAMQVAAQSAAKRDQLDKQQQIEGTRMGLEIAKNKFQAMQNRNRPSKEKN